MLAGYESYVPDYKKEKDRYFLKYKRKVDAMISNIQHSSIKEGDKRKLIKGLANRLMSEIK